MTSFNSVSNIKYPAQNHGADRFESAVNARQQPRQGFYGTLGLATLLRSAIVAAIMVIAYEVMDSAAEGHLLMMWVVMWVATFAVLAMFAGAARKFAMRVKTGLDNWSRELARSRADQRLWHMAQGDSRLMADLQSAMMREEALLEAENAQYDDVRAIVAIARPARSLKLKLGGKVLRAYQNNSL